MDRVNAIYKSNLKSVSFNFEIIQGVWAIPDCDDKGTIPLKWKVPKKYVIIQQVGEEQYICSCDEHSHTGDCYHIQVGKDFIPRIDIVDSESIEHDSFYAFGQQDILWGVYSHSSKTFGVVRNTKNNLFCLSCRRKRGCTSCLHAEVLIKLKHEGSQHNPLIFTSISKNKLEYPLPQAKCDMEKAYKAGQEAGSIRLVPEYIPSKQCDHGNVYSSECPVTMGWVLNKNAKLHHQFATFEAKLYYRPVHNNSCDCKQEYDGLNDLLFNLDNTHLFAYEWLYRILFNMQKGILPLNAVIESANEQRKNFHREPLTSRMYDRLRHAYNAFIRCLTLLDQPESYKCVKCPPSGPDIIVMDATRVGCQKKKMAKNILIPNDNVAIAEGKNCTKALLTKEIRTSIKQYLNDTRGLMQERNFQVLLDNLQRRMPSLKSLLEEVGLVCPDSLQKLLKALSSPNPACGVFQHVGDDARIARDILREVATGVFRRTETHREHLEKYAPLLVDFVCSMEVPQYLISPVIDAILSAIDAPYQVPQPDPASYGIPASACQTPLDWFPAFLTWLGKANYGADRTANNDEDHCNKYSYGHRTLSPGIFTILCNHGICHGFQLMDKPESPRTAFDILVTRFKTLPSIVVYDNACRLHAMILKREPHRFRDTIFLVDRFHSTGHTCSDGYHMDTYHSNKKIRDINSQLCEHSNKDIRKLTSQVACMSSDNAIVHLSTLFGIRNKNVNEKNKNK